MTDAAVRLDHVVVPMEASANRLELDLTVPSGEFLAVTGPSRSGKSLLIELCAGLVAPKAGRVIVLGLEWQALLPEESAGLRLRIGTVLQQPGLLSNMTLYNNVALPLRYHEGVLGEAAIDGKVGAALEALDLTHLRDRFPAELNPGEIRRAAIARAIMLDPELLLLDDAVAGLDAEAVGLLAGFLDAWHHRGSRTVLATMRTASPLLRSADRSVFLCEGQLGSVEANRGRGSEIEARRQAYHL